MAFRQWKIGLHIQQDGIFSVAIAAGRRGQTLRRWWHFPLPHGVIVQGRIKSPEQLLTVLRPWRHALPQRHCVRLAFPAGQTLQRKLPRPAISLRERELSGWVSHSVSRELEMAESDLCFDFTEDEPGNAYGVTAAQNKDVATLLSLAQSLSLTLSSITPDAAALQPLVPWLLPPVRCLAWHDERQWLWATKESWGRRGLEEANTVAQLAALLGLATDEIALCGEAEGEFDCWSVIPWRQPPLPKAGASYAVALGLALAGRC
ncbi:DNA utilization protein HofM [Kosakonia sp. ML.JS2a]|uniref:DNA utilization protein HofM n=1 Tax=Kosakonia sp. ML.JS2a TaxID=2980557 RepID=UPI0021D8A267|nr:DNA utilization protein HofM [Kosakonia sp. ML.JS2a]UXY11322.1 DNA utilization protein HofM [Kosakonia sp. ML.JS2a]